MATNRYPGFCVTCRAQVSAEHGQLTRSAGGAWVVQCEGTATAKPARRKAAPRRSDLTTDLTGAEGQIIAGAPRGIKRATEKRNKKADACMHCGAWLGPGDGVLIFCCEDSGCLEHHDHSGYHVACPDKAACDARRAEARAARAAKRAEAEAARVAAQAAADRKAAEYATARESLIAGLERCSAAPTVAIENQTEVARNDTGVFRCTLHEGWINGARVVVEHMDGADDWRVEYYLPAEVARAARLAYAGSVGVTPEKAAEWLRQYRGCSGTDIYEEVCRDAGISTPEKRGVA